MLGGGGITGIAWETGMVAGLLDAGIDLRQADRVLGTSAGSVVGAQLRSGTSVEDLFATQTAEHVPRPGERTASVGPRVLLGYVGSLARARGDGVAMARHLGGFAVRRAAAGRTPTLEARLTAIRGRLPSLEWPAEHLAVTAVDAATGALRVLDAEAGVPLLDAVAASCAVPGVYPPVPIEGRPHIDGGALSGTHADLLGRECERVVVLAPINRGLGPMKPPGELLGDVPHVVLAPDQASRAAIGRNVLDPAAGAGSARAGREQAARVVDRVRDLWG